VVHGYDEELSGEAMSGGPLTLSWHDVDAGSDAGPPAYNVVIHECAHVLDMRNGEPDGIPPLPRGISPRHWVQVMEAARARLLRRSSAGEPTCIDPYGAEAPEEFFAVACEAFFVKAPALQDEEPYVYELLQAFFRPSEAATNAR
jgi:Mlc titration factor MtfA (ptsG expression regulator)